MTTAQSPVCCKRVQMCVPSAHGAHSCHCVYRSGRNGRATRDPPRQQAQHTNKRAAPNLDAIQSSGPGTSISGSWTHLVVLLERCDGENPSTPTGSCNAAVPSCWGPARQPDRATLPRGYCAECASAYPPAHQTDTTRDPADAGRGVIKLGSLAGALGPSLPRHAAMQGPLQRRDWNRLR